MPATLNRTARRTKPPDRKIYIRLINRDLPIPPRNEAQNDILLDLEDREEALPPEEEAFSDFVAGWRSRSAARWTCCYSALQTSVKLSTGMHMLDDTNYLIAWLDRRLQGIKLSSRGAMNKYAEASHSEKSQ